MKKLLLLILPLYTLFATDVFWYDSYKEAQEEAKETHKAMLVFMTQAGCKSCEIMEDDVLPQEKISSYLDKHYVCMLLDIHDNDAPKDLQVPFTPVFHFLNAQGEMIKESLLGRQKEEVFLKHIQLN